MIFSIIFKYIIASLLVSLIFGLTVSSSIIIKKVIKKNIISPYLFQIWSLVLFIMIWIYYKPNISIFSTCNLFTWKNILIIFIAVIPASIIASSNKKIRPTKPMIIHFIDGATMEIPMRLLIQNLYIILGANVLLFNLIPLEILLTALIFIQFILAQEIIGGRKLTKAILPEVIASFWFSIWVGILYKDTGNILMPMLAHGLQRIVTYKICSKFRKQGNFTELEAHNDD